MMRLFAPPTRDAVLSRHPLTAGSLLLHLLLFGVLLVPIGSAVKSSLLDRQLIFLVPPDRNEGPDRGLGRIAFEAAPSIPAGGVEAVVPGVAEETTVAGGDTSRFSAAGLGAMALPRKEEVAVTELDVDSAVVRDPLSAAPEYPPSLLSKGISGSASVRYVVDTLGVVDTISYRVVAATHVDFAAAVRRALPGMRFRPAIQRGHKVRQWVEQTFNFRIAPRDTTQDLL